VQFRAARSTADARAHFVYVHDDGSARELTTHEAEYLATAFDPADGGRPYIKTRYRGAASTRRSYLFFAATGHAVRTAAAAPGEPS
jgi:hypothetical protein